MFPGLRTFTLLLLTWFPVFLQAQKVVSFTTKMLDYRIPYRPDEGSAYYCGNSLLKELAKDVLREPWLVNIHISCRLGLTIMKDDAGDRLVISLKARTIGGDTVFRRFPLTGVLFPSRLSLKLRWANRADTSGFTEESLQWKPVSISDSLVCLLHVAPFDPSLDTLLVRDVEFSYDSLALQVFLDRIALIHDYYASVSLLDSLQRFTANLQLDDVRLLPVNYLKAEELSRMIERVAERDFPGSLLRDGYDPLRLMDEYSRVYKHSRSLVFNLVDKVHSTGVIDRGGDAGRLAEYFTSRVLSYVQRSFLMDQQQGRIYSDCLDSLFNRSGFPREEHIAARILSKMFPDAGRDTIAAYISRQIYASYQGTAQRLMEQNRFAEAFSLLGNGKLFVARNPYLKDYPTDDRLQSQAAIGIWNSYLGIASACIKGHKYDMAGGYLAKADRYAVANAGYIKDDSAYRVLFSELFFLRNTDCDRLLEQKKYTEALDCYQQFERNYSVRDLSLVGATLDEKISLARSGLAKQSVQLSEDALQKKDADTALFYYERATALLRESGMQGPSAARVDSLAPVMARIRYDHVFNDGTLALEKRQFTLSVTLFREAITLADANGIARSLEFDSLYRQAMKKYLIVQLSAAQKKIWNNQFDSAEMALSRTMETGEGFGLLDEPDFDASLENYRVKIREQQCRNLSDSVDLRMIRADRAIALRNYVNALAYLGQALDFIRTMPVCGIAVQPVMDTISKYGEAAAYQQKLADVRSHVATGDYSGAVRELDESEKDYKNCRLSRFGLSFQSAADFIRERGNPYLTEKAVAFYAALGDDRTALGFLLMAYEQGLTAGRLDAIQEQLGRNFAAGDNRDGALGHEAKDPGSYVPEGKWFDAFRRSYTREQNRVQGK